MSTVAEAIATISLFSGLSREDLARIVAKLEEQRYSPGQIIVKQGVEGDALYIVQSGAAEVVLESDGVGMESLTVLGPHESFGEMALFTGEPRSATVRAFVDSVVLKLSKENWEDLISKHLSLSLHFCKLLSHRLAETDRDLSKGRGAFNMVLEEFFAEQPGDVQDFLTRTAILQTLDPEAIRAVLAIDNPSEILRALSSSHPPFLQFDQNDCYNYRDNLHDFLTRKIRQMLAKDEIEELHRRFARYFSSQSRWQSAIHHYMEVEAWDDALRLIKAHAEELLECEPPKGFLTLLGAIPNRLARADGELARIRAQAHLKLGNLDGAIDVYQDFLAQKEPLTADLVQTAQYYQELAELHQRRGDIAEALGCLRMTAAMLEEEKGNLGSVDAMTSIEALQERSGRQRDALNWSSKALHVAAKLKPRFGGGILSSARKEWLGPLIALGVGSVIWQMPPAAPLDERGIHFLATLAAAVILWVFDIYDQHIVALALLPVWIVTGIAPVNLALAGFSKSSWFFVLAALGMGAAITRSGLLYRVALKTLRRLPANYTVYTLVLGASGLLATPLLPSARARLAVIAPISMSICDAIGFKPRSNGSAGLVLAAYIGFSQLSFVFLTGANFTLIGWNLLPEAEKANFGWAAWTLAALPGGILTLVILLLSIQIFFRLTPQEQPKLLSTTLDTQLEILGPLTRAEWLSLGIFAFALTGWIAKPLHGIDETWVAVAAFLALSLTGVLDHKGLKNNIDWGLLLLVGVLLSLAGLVPALKVDRWLIVTIGPILSAVSADPLSFLALVALMVYALSFFLRRPAAVMVVMLSLSDWAQNLGIHPGVFLVAVCMAVDSWFFPYQSDSYQIAYYSTDEKAFSHAQARKLMIVKFFASFLAIAISIPYWRALGFVK